MLRLPELEIRRPGTLDEALAFLAGPDSTVVAGGTDLYPNLKRRQIKVRNLVSLLRLTELRQIAGDAKTGFSVGAAVTLAQVAGSDVVGRYYPALARAARLVATPQLRNAGTLGGNVCLDTRCLYYNQSRLWRESAGYCLKTGGPVCRVAPKSSRCLAVSSADTAPVLVALGARLRLVGPGGERQIPVEDFFGRDGIDHLTLRPREILTDIILPPAEGLQMAYLKLRRRNSFDFPVAGVAVVVETHADQTVKRARVVLGALESRPLLLVEAGEAMTGNRLNREIIEAVVAAAYRQARPVDNTDMEPWYRKQMAGVLTRRALESLT